MSNEDSPAPGSDSKPPGRPYDAEITGDYNPNDTRAERLAEILEGYLAENAAGHRPDRQKLLDEHPDLAKTLAACLAGIDFINVSNSAAEINPTRELGDFKIVREVGRGGMGAVYEAQQKSLGRRVALKVLCFGGASDSEALQRFQREAATVAGLHHTNIVPIFAVGSQDGVHYYAMQFIEGESLDRVLKSRREPTPISDITSWGIQAADALEHAHARSVIHRDVKPSNLILDHDGRLWLTDFGLAKRLDDVSLSLAGTVLGTPRYMSPEQATISEQHLDHRTDIYSLGATLYELATGQPVVAGNTPREVIRQILNQDPIPPRRWRPDLPRDLERILLKCLAKDSRDRYLSARRLADDLRAVAEGRPIAARPLPMLEQASRWLRRHKQRASWVTSVAFATLLAVFVSMVGFFAWQRSQLAFVNVTADNTMLVGQWLRDGSPHFAPFTIPTQSPLELPSGEYQLLLSGDGRLSRTLNINLTAGHRHDLSVSLDDQLTWAESTVAHSFQTFEYVTPTIESSESRLGVLEFDEDGFRCRAGASGEELWRLNLMELNPRSEEANTSIAWPWDEGTSANFTHGLGCMDGRPYVVGVQRTSSSNDFSAGMVVDQTSPGFQFLDVDQDGHSEVLVAVRHQSWLVAINVQSGKPSWLHFAEPESEDITSGRTRYGTVAHPPLLVPDQNGDGVADVVVVFAFASELPTVVERRVHLLSGVDGHSLWSLPLTSTWFVTPGINTFLTNPDLAWHIGSGRGYSSGGIGGLWYLGSFRRDRRDVEMLGQFAELPSRPELMLYRKENRNENDTPGELESEHAEAQDSLVFLAGQKVLQVDLATGKLSHESEPVGFVPSCEPRFTDMDGDGNLDMLLVEALPNEVKRLEGGALVDKHWVKVRCWSIYKQEFLWESDVEAYPPRQQSEQVAAPVWPVFNHSRNSGSCLVIVPSRSTLGEPAWHAQPWGELTALDGRSGKPVWTRRIYNVDQQIEYFSLGPDLDQDGWPEVYVASLWGTALEIYVDCLSGKTGQPLWRSSHKWRSKDPDNSMQSIRLAELSWLPAPNTAPQLIVTVRADTPEVRDHVCLFDSVSGEVQQFGQNISQVVVGQLDADDIADLLLFQRTSTQRWTAGGRLYAHRGTGSDGWIRSGQLLTAVGDLDQDGIRDLVSYDGNGRIAAYSGANNQILWQLYRATDDWAYPLLLHPASQSDAQGELISQFHDLNRDSVPDMLLVSPKRHSINPKPLLFAVSGSDGRALWKSQLETDLVDALLWIDVRDLNDDEYPEIIVLGAFSHGVPARQPFNQGVQLWLAVIDGRSGETWWQVPLTDSNQNNQPPLFQFGQASVEVVYADQNDDGVLDLLTPAQRVPGSTALEWRCLDGRTGRKLWGSSLAVTSVNPAQTFDEVCPAAVIDLKGDGRKQFVTVSLIDGTAPIQHEGYVQLSALRRDTGEVEKSWQTFASYVANQFRGEITRQWSRLRAIPLRRTGGQHGLAIVIRDSANQDNLHVLDESLRAVGEPWVLINSRIWGSRVWTARIDGRDDDLLFIEDQESILCLETDPDLRLRWRQTLPNQLDRIVGVQSKAGGSADVVALFQDRAIWGLDAATGAVNWQSVGLGASESRVSGPPALLSPGDHKRPPLILDQYDIHFAARPAVFQQSPTAQRLVAARFNDGAIRAQANLPRDPRHQRPLPWHPAEHEIPTIRQQFIAHAYYGFCLIVLPGSYALWLYQRRQWKLKYLLALPVVVIIMLFGYQPLWHGLPNFSLAEKIGGGILLCLPVAVALSRFYAWSVQKNWYCLVSTVVLGVVWIGALMTYFLIDGSQPRGLESEEYYNWNGWAWILLPAGYALVWSVTLLSFGTIVYEKLRGSRGV